MELKTLIFKLRLGLSWALIYHLQILDNNITTVISSRSFFILAPELFL